MRVHVIETGQVIINGVVARGPENPVIAFGRALATARKTVVPIHAYVIEHPEGLMVVDAGLHAEAAVPWWMRHFFRVASIDPDQEVGPQMRAKGLRPEDVRWVIPTHLHMDHAGGLRHFPDAEIIVHRPEYEKGPFGRRVMDERRLWPEWLNPTVYELDEGPYHSFEASKTFLPDVKLVPTPGHSVGHVAILVETDGPTLFFAGDHCIRQDWFVEDLAANRLVMAGFDAKTSRITSNRIAAFVREVPTILIPAHDETAAERLAAREPVRVAAPV